MFSTFFHVYIFLCILLPMIRVFKTVIKFALMEEIWWKYPRAKGFLRKPERINLKSPFRAKPLRREVNSHARGRE